jgi:hypothetical protein
VAHITTVITNKLKKYINKEYRSAKILAEEIKCSTNFFTLMFISDSCALPLLNKGQ